MSDYSCRSVPIFYSFWLSVWRSSELNVSGFTGLRAIKSKENLQVYFGSRQLTDWSTQSAFTVNNLTVSVRDISESVFMRLKKNATQKPDTTQRCIEKGTNMSRDLLRRLCDIKYDRRDLWKTLIWIQTRKDWSRVEVACDCDGK